MAKFNRGLEGLDALILFIAVVLSVSVIAAILMNTSSSLSNKAQTQEKEKTKNLQRPIIVESVRGVDNNNDKRLDLLAFTIRMKEGSEPTSFNDTVILVNSKVVNCTGLSYGPSAPADCSYTLTYLKRGPDFDQDRFNLGDLVELDFAGPNIIRTHDESSDFNFVPSRGVSTQIKVSIPERIVPQNMGLWPLND